MPPHPAASAFASYILTPTLTIVVRERVHTEDGVLIAAKELLSERALKKDCCGSMSRVRGTREGGRGLCLLCGILWMVSEVSAGAVTVGTCGRRALIICNPTAAPVLRLFMLLSYHSHHLRPRRDVVYPPVSSQQRPRLSVSPTPRPESFKKLGSPGWAIRSAVASSTLHPTSSTRPTSI